MYFLRDVEYNCYNTIIIIVFFFVLREFVNCNFLLLSSSPVNIYIYIYTFINLA